MTDQIHLYVSIGLAILLIPIIRSWFKHQAEEKEFKALFGSLRPTRMTVESKIIALSAAVDNEIAEELRIGVNAGGKYSPKTVKKDLRLAKKRVEKAIATCRRACKFAGQRGFILHPQRIFM